MGFELSLTLFLTVTAIYIVIIDVFAVFFRVAGLTKEQARFQTVSLLTNSGYTTAESEMIVEDPQRRRLARTIMMFGYIFNVTVVGVLVNLVLQLPSSKADSVLPALIIGVTLFLIFIFLRRIRAVHRAFNALVARWARHRLHVTDNNSLVILRTFPEGIVAMVQCKRIPEALKDKSIEAWNHAKGAEAHVLYIDRDGHIILPAKNVHFAPGDSVVVCGQVATIRSLLEVPIR